MMGKKKLIKMAKAGLKEADGYESEILLENYRYDLTRFFEGQIHQNLAMSGVYVTVRVYEGQRRGEVSSFASDTHKVKETVQKALGVLQYGAVGPYRPLPSEDFGCVTEDEPLGFDERVLSDGARWRTETADRVVKVVQGEGPRPFGRVITEFSERLIMNSDGLISYAPHTGCDVNITAIRDDGYGAAERHSYNLDDIKPAKVASEAAGGCNLARNPESFPQGDYPVILLPYATADVASFVARLGADGEAISEGRSFMSGRFGDKVVSEKITIYDDGFDERGRPLAFDSEGVKKQKVNIIDEGIASGALYNQTTAASEGCESTGHSPVGRAFDSFRGGTSVAPQNLFMVEGDATVAEMIEDTDMGLLITNFHYTRIVEPRDVVITGMTRNGTFLVRDGHVVGPVKNLRFTDSYVRILNEVSHVGEESMLSSTGVGGIRVPAVRLNSLRFTGTTDF